MTIVIDTGVILALYDPEDDLHQTAAAFYDGVDEDVVTTPMIAAEMDHLVLQRGGRETSQLLWSDFDSGAIQVRWWATAMTESLAIARRRPALELADASLLALAPVVRTTRIATFDRTHFSAVRTTGGEPFTLLP